MSNIVHEEEIQEPPYTCLIAVKYVQESRDI